MLGAFLFAIPPDSNALLVAGLPWLMLVSDVVKNANIRRSGRTGFAQVSHCLWGFWCVLFVVCCGFRVGSWL
jgi:hypothetical protein